jgi:hypothetical protein
VQSLQSSLKAANPAPHFRGDSDVFSKHLGESAFAYSYGSGTLGDAEIFVPEEMHCLIDHFRTPYAWMEAFGQKILQRPQLLDGRGSLAQPVDE